MPRPKGSKAQPIEDYLSVPENNSERTLRQNIDICTLQVDTYERNLHRLGDICNVLFNSSTSIDKTEDKSPVFSGQLSIISQNLVELNTSFNRLCCILEERIGLNN